MSPKLGTVKLDLGRDLSGSECRRVRSDRTARLSAQSLTRVSVGPHTHGDRRKEGMDSRRPVVELPSFFEPDWTLRELSRSPHYRNTVLRQVVNRS